MDDIAKRSNSERAELFSQTAAKDGRFNAAIVEKDFWVCWMLNRLFSSELRNKLIFKGGTSLSKVFNLIERFSEDIDLILNWQGLIDEDPMQARNKTRQGKLNKRLDDAGERFIHDNLFPTVHDLCAGICDVFRAYFLRSQFVTLKNNHCLMSQFVTYNHRVQSGLLSLIGGLNFQLELLAQAGCMRYFGKRKTEKSQAGMHAVLWGNLPY